jgi:hypothetical protein
MTAAQAEALVAGQKIQYSDGRVATVTISASEPDVGEVTIVFDADTQNPKSVCHIKVYDFVRAELLPAQQLAKAL